MQIVVEVVERIDLLQDFLSNVLVSVLNLTNGVGTEVCSCPEVQVFAEGEATQVVACTDTVQLRVFVFQAHHAGAGKDHFEVWAAVIDEPEVVAPIGVLEHLVDEQYLSSCLHELLGKLEERFPLEIEVVHVDVETPAVLRAEVLFGILEQEGCSAYAATAFDADESLVPVNFIHEGTSDGGLRALHQILMHSIERLEHNIII